MLSLKKLNLFLLTYSLVFFSCGSDKDPEELEVEVTEDVFINEIYASGGEDWIELYNSSTTEKDISGYKIFDDPANKYSLPANTKVAANGFLILICDDAGTGLNTNFKLTSQGETVFLENASGKIIDKVTFPSLADGQAYGRFPDGSTNLGTTGSSTRGEPNGDSRAPVISIVSRSVMVPALDEAVTVTADVASNNAIEKVELFHKTDDGDFQVIEMTSSSSGQWKATIPALNNTGTVRYYVKATNNVGGTALSPFDAPDETYFYVLNTDALPQLRINEFMASNVSTLADPDAEEQEFDDWIEIYNAGTTPIDVGGMYLSDNISDPFKNRIPTDNPAVTTIPAGGFLLLFADEQGSQGELHLNFKLAADGEDVALFYIDGRTIDSYSFSAQQEDISMGLNPDGSDNWQYLNTPTPGSSNDN